jgi:hypothetical protein
MKNTFIVTAMHNSHRKRPEVNRSQSELVKFHVGRDEAENLVGENASVAESGQMRRTQT